MRLPAIFKRDVLQTTLDDVAGLTGIVDGTNFATFLQGLVGVSFSPRLLHRVWVANRCIQLNSQQIASMPLRFLGARAPAWLTNPDPTWYPNGIGDAVFAGIRSMYGWGDAFLYVAARYADGLPSAWTVLDPAAVTVESRRGVRVYKVSGRELNRDDVVQITRNPTGALRGTSALDGFASHLWAALTSAELARAVQGENSAPPSVLKSSRKLTEQQARQIQDQWAKARAGSSGRPPVLPPELDLADGTSFSPKDLMLLEAQEFNARVIAAAFNVPAFMLNLPLVGGLTYQNPEILFDFWWRAELRPIAKRFADALTSQMLPRGSSVRFDARETLEPGLKDLHSIWKEAADAGYVTADEYRRAVLQLGPIGETGAIDELLEPATAGASPADQPAENVVAIRPAGVVT